jgi:hypothetical protein
MQLRAYWRQGLWRVFIKENAKSNRNVEKMYYSSF